MPYTSRVTKCNQTFNVYGSVHRNNILVYSSITCVSTLFVSVKTEENLPPCKSLASRATGGEIFIVIHSNMTEHEISWEKCVDTCTGYTRAMTG
jgi:hypothetical protein